MLLSRDVLYLRHGGDGIDGDIVQGSASDYIQEWVSANSNASFNVYLDVVQAHFRQLTSFQNDIIYDT